MALLHKSEPQLLRTLRQEYPKFKASLCKLAKPCLNLPKTNKQKPHLKRPKYEIVGSEDSSIWPHSTGI